MRTFLIFINILFFTTNNSQPDYSLHTKTPYTRIIYSFSHMRDTNNPQRFYKEKMQLICDNKVAFYTSYTKFQQDSIREVQIQQAEKAVGNNVVVNRGILVPYTNEEIKTSSNEKIRNIFLNFNNSKYKITESIEPIKWQIEKDVKKIAGYTCQKATCNFRGRKYMAWFTTDIPLSFGPWKLHGLPGLILEASDEKNQVNFKCESVSTLANISEIPFPQDGIKTTMNEYNRMVEAYQNNPGSFSSSSPGIKIEKVKIESSGSTSKKSSMNNPIELSNE